MRGPEKVRVSRGLSYLIQGTEGRRNMDLFCSV